jgi:hypothetical protein
MRNFILIVSFLITSLSYAQEVSSVQKSSIPDSTAYFVNGKLALASDLKLIPQDAIQSVNVIKRDTVVNQSRYKAQIFVILKSKDPK